jgi:competence protein ComEC
MPKDFYNNLRQTGTIHMMVASGMNVTIVGMTTLSLALLFLSRKIAVMLSLILIWFYVLLAGGEAPVVRAGIMGSLVFLAQIAGREADAWRGLILAAGILLFLNPLSFFDLGFQLSFAATAGILLFTPWFNSHLSRFPNQIKIDLSQTMGAQIATMPIILLNFGYYSSLSPLANVLIVSTLPWIMRLGLLGVLFWPILYLTLPLLTYVVKVIEWFGK